MEPELISILTPFFNTERYLTDCIQSVLDQTYSNWEMICVDDFCTDESRAIVQSFSKKDPRIKLFNNAEKGIISALRIALSKSKGTFITRMDSDDVMKPEKLSIMVNQLCLHGPGHVAVGPVKYFADYPIKDGFARYEEWLNGLIAKGNNFDELYKECVIPSPSWLLFREDLDKCDAFNPSTYPEDYDLVFRMYERGIQCLPASEVLHLWRDHGERASRNDKNYADNSFIHLKINYFLKLHHQNPLLIWGAGTKGKQTAKELQKRAIPFTWACDNPNKIGKEIYNTMMLDINKISDLRQFQSIITVANTEAQTAIKEQLNALSLKQGVDYFFFC